MLKYVPLLACLVPLLGYSQSTDYTFYNKGAEIYVQQGGLIHVQGKLTNDNGSANGSIENNGIIEVKGDLENKTNASFGYDPLFASPDRAVRLVGTGTQYIEGDFSSANASLYNLVVDQLSDADTVALKTNTNLKGSLLFGSTANTSTYSPGMFFTNHGTHGLLKTFDVSSEYLLDIQNGNTDAIAGYPTMAINLSPATAYILTKGSRGSAGGGMQRKVDNQAAYDFPIGTEDNGYNAVRLNFTQIAAGGSIKGKFCDGTTNPRGYVGTLSQTCIGCTGNYTVPDNPGYNHYFANNPCNGGQGQWLILEESGVLDHGYWSFDATNNNLGQWKYEIEVFPNSFTLENGGYDNIRTIKYHDSNADFGYDPSDLTVNWSTQIDNVSDPSDLLTYTRNLGCYTGDGIPGGIYTDFSHFSIHTSNSSNALPVELIYLKAEPVNNNFIKISWATALEVNNDGFEVLRSTDGVSFTNIGWVDGHNNTTTIQNYAFDDNNVAPNIVYYYKLNQIDNDGHHEETYVVSAMITNGSTFAISDFIPNPAVDASKIIITTSSAQHIGIKLFDVIGQQIQADRDYNLTAGQNYINFDAQNLAAGTYTAIISTSNKSYSKKLIVTGN